MVSKLGMNDKIGLRGFKIEDYVKTMSQETLKVFFFLSKYSGDDTFLFRKLMMKSMKLSR